MCRATCLEYTLAADRTEGVVRPLQPRRSRPYHLWRRGITPVYCTAAAYRTCLDVLDRRVERHTADEHCAEFGQYDDIDAWPATPLICLGRLH